MKIPKLFYNKKSGEDYCDYDLAELLEKQGFNFDCKYVFERGNKDKILSIDDVNYSKARYLLIPTLECAAKYLRNIKNRPIQLLYSYVKKEWGSCISTVYDEPKYFWHPKYEFALAQAIANILEDLSNK